MRDRGREKCWTRRRLRPHLSQFVGGLHEIRGLDRGPRADEPSRVPDGGNNRTRPGRHRPQADDVAAVMGHEISHALREHSREQASHQAAQGLLINLVGAATGYGALVQDLGPAVLNVMFNLPHSRTDETEADRMGVELAARAGFDPHASVSLWQKMGKLGGGKPPEWLSTHPSDERR